RDQRGVLRESRAPDIRKMVNNPPYMLVKVDALISKLEVVLKDREAALQDELNQKNLLSQEYTAFEQKVDAIRIFPHQRLDPNMIGAMGTAVIDFEIRLKSLTAKTPPRWTEFDIRKAELHEKVTSLRRILEKQPTSAIPTAGEEIIRDLVDNQHFHG